MPVPASLIVPDTLTGIILPFGGQSLVGEADTVTTGAVRSNVTVPSVTVDSLSAPSTATSNTVNLPSAASVGNVNVPFQIPSKLVPDWRVNVIVPTIAGRSPSYIGRAIYDFQQSARSGANAALMKPAVQKLTEDDTIALAAYIASLEP